MSNKHKGKGRLISMRSTSFHKMSDDIEKTAREAREKRDADDEEVLSRCLQYLTLVREKPFRTRLDTQEGRYLEKLARWGVVVATRLVTGETEYTTPALELAKHTSEEISRLKVEAASTWEKLRREIQAHGRTEEELRKLQAKFE